MKRLLILSMLLLIFLAGCQNQYYTPKKYTSAIIEEKTVATPVSLRLELYPNAVSPQVLTVKEGSEVSLEVISNLNNDVNLGIDKFSINQRIVPNQPMSISFTANKIGTYRIYVNNTPMGNLVVN